MASKKDAKMANRHVGRAKGPLAPLTSLPFRHHDEEALRIRALLAPSAPTTTEEETA